MYDITRNKKRSALSTGTLCLRSHAHKEKTQKEGKKKTTHRCRIIPHKPRQRPSPIFSRSGENNKQKNKLTNSQADDLASHSLLLTIGRTTTADMTLLVPISTFIKPRFISYPNLCQSFIPLPASTNIPISRSTGSHVKSDQPHVQLVRASPIQHPVVRHGAFHGDHHHAHVIRARG